MTYQLIAFENEMYLMPYSRQKIEYRIKIDSLSDLIGWVKEFKEQRLGDFFALDENDQIIAQWVHEPGIDHDGEDYFICGDAWSFERNKFYSK